MTLLDIPKIVERNIDLKVFCPHCRSQYFWTRPIKKDFDKVGAVTIKCIRCRKLYWVIRKRDRSGFYVRTAREEVLPEATARRHSRKVFLI